jgi:DNA polymerase I-like protein with 3'-5' exonuclease and polymerase domains
MKHAETLVEGNRVVMAPMSEPPPEMVEAFHKAKVLYVDTETTGLSPWRSETALVQIYEPLSQQVFLGRVWSNWKPEQWFTDLFVPMRTFVGHNIAQFDLQFLTMAGVPWKNAKYFDTLIGETICATSARSGVSKSLRASVKRRTGYVVNKDITHGHWRDQELTDEQIQYAAIDVLVLPELYVEQQQRASDTGQTQALAMEMSVLPMFASMYLNGLPIHMPSLMQYMNDQRIKFMDAEQLLRRRLGELNFGSPVQLRRALNAIGIDIESTAKDILIDQILFDPESDNAQLLQAILDWRAPHKRTEMYGSEDWQTSHIELDGRIHARFWQVGADTTRVSSSDPNLQQVPKDGRWVFGHVPDHKIISVDYSQIEVRIAASIANDQALLKVLEEDDVHRSIASQVFACHPADVTPKQRKLAKAMVFCLLFGASWKRFYQYARRSGSDMTEGEAIELFHAFFAAFQGLWNMRQKAYAISRTRRVVVITLPNSSRRVLVGPSNRPTIILNTPVQGSAAVGMKLGLIDAYKHGLDQYVGAVVHDESVSCVPDSDAEDYAHEMQASLMRGMQTVVQNAPVKAEIARMPDGTLPNWWLA